MVTYFQLTDTVRLYLEDGVKLPIPGLDSVMEMALNIANDAEPPFEWMELGFNAEGGAEFTGHIAPDVWADHMEKLKKKEEEAEKADEKVYEPCECLDEPVTQPPSPVSVEHECGECAACDELAPPELSRSVCDQ